MSVKSSVGERTVDEKKKTKTRFNFVDVLLLAALLMGLLAIFGGLLNSFSSENKDMVVTVQLKASDVERAAATNLLISAGSAVYGAESEELLGYLAKDYTPGAETIDLRVKTSKQGSDHLLKGLRLYVGQTIDLRSEGLLCYEAVVKDLKEAAEYE